MKKRFLVLFVLACLCSVCFGQTSKFRYVYITEKAVVIADLKEELPKEKLESGYPMILPLNTKDERFRAESGIRMWSHFSTAEFHLSMQIIQRIQTIPT
ncbi:MAG: hypothetical protein J5857_03540 [Treponema sp.]|nr:hypothetical protein [Treponema sp.]